jgi:hypothetical protein
MGVGNRLGLLPPLFPHMGQVIRIGSEFLLLPVLIDNLLELPRYRRLPRHAGDSEVGLNDSKATSQEHRAHWLCSTLSVQSFLEGGSLRIPVKCGACNNAERMGCDHKTTPLSSLFDSV